MHVMRYFELAGFSLVVEVSVGELFSAIMSKVRVR